MPITALPALDRTSATFKTDADAFFGSQLPAFAAEANALQTDVNAKQVLATAAAVTAATQAANSADSALAAAGSAAVVGAVAWVSGTTYAIGDARYSPINLQTYRRKVAGAGTTDPSLDTTNWAKAVDVLPAQTGNGGKYLTTNGTAESWGAVPASALTLLATLTPTAADNVDALNVFTSGYDSYLIILSGLKPATTGGIGLRLAVGGAVNSGSVYIECNSTSGATYTFCYLGSGDDVASTGLGISSVINITGANSTAGQKTIQSQSTFQDQSGFGRSGDKSQIFNVTSAVSGFRLFWRTGATFAASGKIQIYGYSNT
jgi:hypothetical protein